MTNKFQFVGLLNGFHSRRVESVSAILTKMGWIYTCSNNKQKKERGDLAGGGSVCFDGEFVAAPLLVEI